MSASELLLNCYDLVPFS